MLTATQYRVSDPLTDSAGDKIVALPTKQLMKADLRLLLRNQCIHSYCYGKIGTEVVTISKQQQVASNMVASIGSLSFYHATDMTLFKKDPRLTLAVTWPRHSYDTLLTLDLRLLLRDHWPMFRGETLEADTDGGGTLPFEMYLSCCRGRFNGIMYLGMPLKNHAPDRFHSWKYTQDVRLGFHTQWLGIFNRIWICQMIMFWGVTVLRFSDDFGAANSTVFKFASPRLNL